MRRSTRNKRKQHPPPSRGSPQPGAGGAPPPPSDSGNPTARRKQKKKESARTRTATRPSCATAPTPVRDTFRFASAAIMAGGKTSRKAHKPMTPPTPPTHCVKTKHCCRGYRHSARCRVPTECQKDAACRGGFRHPGRCRLPKDCAKSPFCDRGFRHKGKPGRCNANKSKPRRKVKVKAPTVKVKAPTVKSLKKEVKALRKEAKDVCNREAKTKRKAERSEAKRAHAEAGLVRAEAQRARAVKEKARMLQELKATRAKERELQAKERELQAKGRELHAKLERAREEASPTNQLAPVAALPASPASVPESASAAPPGRSLRSDGRMAGDQFGPGLHGEDRTRRFAKAAKSHQVWSVFGADPSCIMMEEVGHPKGKRVGILRHRMENEECDGQVRRTIYWELFIVNDNTTGPVCNMKRSVKKCKTRGPPKDKIGEAAGAVAMLRTWPPPGCKKVPSRDDPRACAHVNRVVTFGENERNDYASWLIESVVYVYNGVHGMSLNLTASPALNNAAILGLYLDAGFVIKKGGKECLCKGMLCYL